MVAVTARAQEKLKAVLDAKSMSEALVRVGVVRGPHGCIHGWNLAIEDLAKPNDTIVASGPVRLAVDPELVEILDGASIDYREDSLGIGFVIEAPNTPPPMHEQGACCGEH